MKINIFIQIVINIFIIMEVYAFAGNLKTGKNYVAEKLFIPLLPFKNTLVMGFADHFKIDAINKENLKYEKVFGEKDDETRKQLQLMGTENGRDKYGQDIWINIVDTWMKIYNERGVERFIITDLRFKNEYEYLKSKNAKIIKIEAPNRQKENLKGQDLQVLNHRSETELNDIEFDYIINNDYNDKIIEDLKCLI